MGEIVPLLNVSELHRELRHNYTGARTGLTGSCSNSISLAEQRVYTWTDEFCNCNCILQIWNGVSEWNVRMLTWTRHGYGYR